MLFSKHEKCYRSGNLAGHVIYDDALPNHLAGNCFSKNVLTMLAKCGAHLIFAVGVVKDQVYRTPVRDLADLQERIYAAVNSVTSQMLHNT